MKNLDLSEKALEHLAEMKLSLRAQSDGDRRLELVDLAAPRMLPLAVDFLKPEIRHRLRFSLSKNEPLPRALGIRSTDPAIAPFVFDATAGLGTDSFIIAALGCRVRGIERSEVASALLLDGLRRLREFESFESEDALAENFRQITARLSFEYGDAREILQTLSEEQRPDVVYLDPMYPQDSHDSSALPKKSMQIFRRMIGADLDAAEVLEIALQRARQRVVVKRPLIAAPLGLQPNHVFNGKTARFDLYLAPEGSRFNR